VNETLKSIIVLTLFSVCGGGIAIFFHSTLGAPIESRTAVERRSTAERMFPAGVSVYNASGKKPLPSCYWVGKKDSAVMGYVFPVETRGYSGTISSLVALDTEGTVLEMKILAQSGAPVQGMTIEDFLPTVTFWNRMFGKKDTTAAWFTEQFKGTNVNKPYSIDTLTRRNAFLHALKKERRDANRISVVDGAAFSTRALALALHKNAAAFLPAVKGKER
jgi:Na+-translocating ferredoxin:NAD+ oxidoreductase RnfG subunit